MPHGARRRCLEALCVVVVAGVLALAAPTSAGADREATPVSGITIPEGYRDWRLISVAHEAGDLNDLRAILGNDIAIEAYRKGQLPFPDGAIIARLAWRYVPSEENNRAFGQKQSWVAGPPTNVQFMIKDSGRWPATSGWGFAQFENGEPAGAAVLGRCFPCHEPVASRDFVFTRYAP